MLKLLNHNIILPKYLEMVKKNKPAEKNAVGSEGEAEGGCGGNSAPKPPSARPQKRPFRIGRFQVFRSAFGGTQSLARFGDKFFLYYLS